MELTNSSKRAALHSTDLGLTIGLVQYTQASPPTSRGELTYPDLSCFTAIFSACATAVYLAPPYSDSIAVLSLSCSVPFEDFRLLFLNYPVFSFVL
jgi:hypothetical protein